MARNDEGDFELVLGNRQLLSVFFILVVLLGVFFTMGYIVGRNNPHGDIIETASMPKGAADPGSANPLVVDSSHAQSAEGVPSSKPSPTHSEPAKTEIIREAKPEAKLKETPHKAEPPIAETRPVAGIVSKPSPGTYLQVVAIDRQGAIILAGSLQKKSIPSIVVPGPTDTIFRVLVGPLKEKDDVARTKTRLEELGFKGPIPRKY